MCIPYIIPDPPPRKRPRKSGLIALSSPPKSPKLQPAFIEISPRLTYVASPKPDRSPIPPRGRPSAMKPPRRAPEAEFLDGFMAGEQASRQEEGRVINSETQPAEPQPISTHPSQEPEPPTKSTSFTTENPTIPQQPQDLPIPLAKPNPFQQRQKPPPPSAPHNPRPTPFASPQPQPQPYTPIRSPYNYTHRPHPTHRTRSLSPSSTISRRSFDRLKRNLHILFERVKVLEAEKDVREADVRRRRKGWELGVGRREGRREGSLIRERREREREKGSGREEERWDWEGGGLGRG